MGLIQDVVAQAIVAAAFRNGPLESIHAGKRCPRCAGKEEYSHVTNDEMRLLMKYAVDRVAALLQLWQDDPETFAKYVTMMNSTYTYGWDYPEHQTQIMQNIKKDVAVREATRL